MLSSRSGRIGLNPSPMQPSSSAAVKKWMSSPVLGAAEVADGVATVVGGLGPLVIVTDVGGGGVDPDAQQASWRHGRSRRTGPAQVR